MTIAYLDALNAAYSSGLRAALHSHNLFANPYDPDSELYDQWARGWSDGQYLYGEV